MNKKGNSELGLIMTLFVGIMVAFALLGPIFNTQSVLTDKLPIYNETHNLNSCYDAATGNVNISKAACNVTLTEAPTGWELTDSQCASSSLTVTKTNATVLVLDTDYSVTLQTGIVAFKNTTATSSTGLGAGSNSTYVNYQYCGLGYNKDSGSRSMARLIGLLSTLALLAFAVLGIKNEWFK